MDHHRGPGGGCVLLVQAVGAANLEAGLGLQQLDRRPIFQRAVTLLNTARNHIAPTSYAASAGSGQAVGCILSPLRG